MEESLEEFVGRFNDQWEDFEALWDQYGHSGSKEPDEKVEYGRTPIDRSYYDELIDKAKIAQLTLNQIVDGLEEMANRI
jgi:hypothetical protein